ncbi:hypothetical protein CRM22_000542 [Opisthorchis felineus]|uniref:NTF2-related export protein n=1 Tax=Opisthorchis felineus TaxID=147828 RepID=A0A4S2MJ09_OPIFE|nr:hypothetical protein CRM22_000542 [Opisthorchis felineus]
MQAIQPSADEIGKQFAAQYYQTLQTSRPAIRNFYHEQARMIYEGDEVVGRENIAQKLQNIKCNTLQFALSSVDAQPCGNAILILVCGQLQFQFFQLKATEVRCYGFFTKNKKIKGIRDTQSTEPNATRTSRKMMMGR